MIFDPSDPLVASALSTRQDWSTTEFSVHIKEEVPSNMPETRGAGFFIRAFVGSSHAGDCVTRRSRTGFLI